MTFSVGSVSTGSPALAKGISMNAVVAAVLLELDGIFILKAEQRTVLKAFRGGKDVSTGVSFHRSPSRLTTGQGCTKRKP